MHFGLILSGVLMLLVGSYLDNARGPLLPVLTQALGLPYGETSYLLVWGNLVAVVMNLSLLPVVAGFGVKRVSLLLCLLPVLVACTGYTVTAPFSLSVFAAVLGGALSMMGVVCNLLVIEGTTPAARSRYFCVLHMMYGFGSLLGPIGVRAVLSSGGRWQLVFWLIVPVAALLAVVLASCQVPKHVRVPKASRKRLYPNGAHWFVIALSSVYVMGEVLTSMWMVPFLVENSGLNVVDASPYLSGFFLFMGLSRALCFFPMRENLEKKVLVGVLFLAAALTVWGHLGNLWAFALAGLMGPFFPLLLGRASRHFHTVATPLTVWILTGIQLTLACSHLTVGKLTDRFGMADVYWLASFCLVATGVMTVIYFWRIEPRAAH